MNVAICCIAYQEDTYIEEWIDYNKKLGFDVIQMYQNKGWKCKAERPFLFKESYTKENSQVRLYNEFLKLAKGIYDYVAFIDCDEYITLRKHSDIKSFLLEHGHHNGVGLNWQYFGSCGKEKRESNSLLKQFIRRQSGVDVHIKSIVNTKTTACMADPHCLNVNLVDTSGRYFQGPFNVGGPADVATINHYHKQSLDDFKIKVAKGREDGGEKRGQFYWNEQHWYDVKDKDADVEDTTARDFMYGI